MSSATASAFLPGVVTTGMPRVGRGRDVDVDRTAAGAADEPQRRRGVEHRVGHRRALDDEHVVAVEAARSPAPACPRTRGCAARTGSLAPTRVVDAVQSAGSRSRGRPRARRSAAPEDRRRAERVADDRAMRSAAAGRRRLGVRSIACPLPGLEDELEHRLGVEVVELDRLADPAAHQHLGAARLEVALRSSGLPRECIMQAMCWTPSPCSSSHSL